MKIAFFCLARAVRILLLDETHQTAYDGVVTMLITTKKHQK